MTGSPERGGPVHVWSTATWNPVRALDERVEGAAEAMGPAASDQALCTALAFSPDGALPAESLDYRLALWRLG
ncbi:MULTISPECIES: hypothetical protein [unclassified Streptomyces]|uniref:hypothetical protein n=1 Tax=unclassified Streptomyces TaxID=2593676 RepID=UPI00093B8D17|nr:hypothetical protein [Streptomyces sp. TSRI0107]OKJ89167.1 hypothetical protein AMK31_04180 [Streptomyces sp. TSRI0107]